MPCPRTLIILGKTYRLVDKRPHEIPLPPDSFWYGQIRHDLGLLAVNPTITPAQQGDTVLHETLHALAESLRLSVSENTVHRLAQGLHSTMTGNPVLFRRIISRQTIPTHHVR